jgi:beta-lactam-binding protein with PASTA domain
MLGDSLRRRQGGLKAKTPGKRGVGRKLLIGVPLALLVPFAIGYLVAILLIFPPREIAAAGIAVPDLTGRTEADANRELRALGLALLEVSEQPHPEVSAGRVIAQSPVAGQQLRSGAGVRVALSAGRPRAIVPNVLGFMAERAQSMIQRSGFRVTTQTQESTAPVGRVIRSDPLPGEERELPATVTLFISAGLPTPPPDTGVIDTLRARPPL